MTIPFVPQIEPTATNSPPSAAIRIHVFILLMPVMYASLAGNESPAHVAWIIPPSRASALPEGNSQELLSASSAADQGGAGDHARERLDVHEQAEHRERGEDDHARDEGRRAERPGLPLHEDH